MAPKVATGFGWPNSELPPPNALPALGAVDPKTLVPDVPAAGVAPNALPPPPKVEAPPPNAPNPVAGFGAPKAEVPVEVAVFEPNAPDSWMLC